MARSQSNQHERSLEAAYAVSVPKMKEIISTAETSVCILNTPPRGDFVGIQGSAGLYELKQSLWAIISNNHVVEFTDYKFICGITLTFELHGGFSLKLRAEYIEHVTTSHFLDATIIEITNEFMLKLERLGLNFLKVKPAEVKQKVALISYPKGEFSIDKGVIETVEGFTLKYYMAGDFGSSGAPIMTWDFFAVGIHKWRGRDSLGEIRVGTSLLEITEFHILECFPILKYCSL
jgi:hypothetical protein